MDGDMQKVPLFSPNHKLGRTTIEKTVSLIGHALEIVIGVTYNFSPSVPPNQKACTSCAILALYPLSFNICIGTFRAFSLSGAPASCSRHFQIKCAEIFGVHFKKKKKLPQIFLQCVYKIFTLVKIVQRVHVIFKLLCPKSGKKCQLPMPPALAGGTNRHCDFALSFLWPSPSVGI